MAKSIESIKKVIRNRDFRNVSSNFFYLLILNVTNFLLPVITFPYLVSRLGVEKFGLLAFVTSIISYLLIFTDYGFNLSATRQISVYRNDKKKINEIVSAVYIIKLLLVAVSVIVLLILVLSVSKFREYSLIYFFTFGTVIGQSLFPIWFFQGIEKMRFISILNIVSKLLFTACVFIFVKNEHDFFLVPVFNSFGYITIGIISVAVLFKSYHIRLQKTSWETIIFYLKDGWHLFISNISVTLYTTAVITILGFYTSNTIVGYYSIADKIIQIIRGMLTPLSQALFPFLVKEAQTDKNRVLRINRKLLTYGSLLFAPLCVAIYMLAPQIIFLIFKKENIEPIMVLRIFAVIPFLIFLANIFALFTMIVFNKNRQYSRIIISAGLLNIILSFVFIPKFHHIGAAFCVLFIELYVTARYIYYTHKNGMRLL
ncbi:flippase [Kaistella sp. DKR-2]|uniref:flippase n=1 Tax=Kaistella soli TaxID=2849654 RepID=UPI001C26EF6E|nr:flippase [Kaistella soli]MBU4538419.1 flippase [Bacteroidota bacterium]MBU8882743.1 flippase [Kaistella soli]